MVMLPTATSSMQYTGSLHRDIVAPGSVRTISLTNSPKNYCVYLKKKLSGSLIESLYAWSGLSSLCCAVWWILTQKKFRQCGIMHILFFLTRRSAACLLLLAKTVMPVKVMADRQKPCPSLLQPCLCCTMSMPRHADKNWNVCPADNSHLQSVQCNV